MKWEKIKSSKRDGFRGHTRILHKGERTCTTTNLAKYDIIVI